MNEFIWFRWFNTVILLGRIQGKGFWSILALFLSHFWSKLTVYFVDPWSFHGSGYCLFILSFSKEYLACLLLGSAKHAQLRGRDAGISVAQSQCRGRAGRGGGADGGGHYEFSHGGCLHCRTGADICPVHWQGNTGDPGAQSRLLSGLGSYARHAWRPTGTDEVSLVIRSLSTALRREITRHFASFRNIFSGKNIMRMQKPSMKSCKDPFDQ